MGSDLLRAELRHAQFAQPQTQVRLVIAQFKTLFAQVQKRKWTLVGSFLGIVYSASGCTRFQLRVTITMGAASARQSGV
jgi:predicted esterase YcpF (UPF0227 family)